MHHRLRLVRIATRRGSPLPTPGAPKPDSSAQHHPSPAAPPRLRPAHRRERAAHCPDGIADTSSIEDGATRAHVHLRTTPPGVTSTPARAEATKRRLQVSIHLFSRRVGRSPCTPRHSEHSHPQPPPPHTWPAKDTLCAAPTRQGREEVLLWGRGGENVTRRAHEVHGRASSVQGGAPRVV